jgi:tetratricopeptide (TPR) repeat protein
VNNQIKIIIGIAVAATFISVPLYLQNNLSGEKPVVPYDTYVRDQNRAANFTSRLSELSKLAEASPNNPKIWKEFANELAQKVYAPEAQSNQGLVIELIDALRHILDLEPNDPETLLSMANINYNFQVFDKAAEYFGAYLKVSKDDTTARATYGSALSFLGQFDEAEKELVYAISQDPKLFLARANLAISFALAGNKVKAKEAQQEALPFAQDNSTKEKFVVFIDEILNPKPNTAKVVEAGPLPQRPTDPALTGLDSDIRSNPVAGPKYVYSRLDGEILILNFANFPMSAMPPFAKDKFVNSIRESISNNKLSQIKEIKFIDHATNETLYEIKL